MAESPYSKPPAREQGSTLAPVLEFETRETPPSDRPPSFDEIEILLGTHDDFLQLLRSRLRKLRADVESGGTGSWLET